MILSKIVSVKVTNKNVSYYKKLYLLMHSGDIIEVNVSDLSHGSKQKINICCDVCGDEKIMAIKDYNRITNNNSEKHFCFKCKNEKTKETNLKKYGVENVFQSDEIKDKSKKTCLKKYGIEYYQKTDEYKNDEVKNKIDFSHSKESIDKMILTTRENYSKIFPCVANKMHDYKYNYSEVNYINSYTKVKIICPKHGIFLQKPGEHLYNKVGCPICKESKGELLISNILNELNIEYNRQKNFS